MHDPLLLALYESVTRDDALQTMLALLAQRFRCRAAAFFYVDRLLPEADVALGHGVFDAEAQRRYREHFASLDPLPAAMTRLPVGRAAASDRLFDPDKIASLAFIRDFYHPLGLREALGGPVVNDKHRLGVVSVQRGADRERFRDDEIRDFERLIPHLSQAIRMRRRFFEIEDRAEGLDSAVEATATAVLILTRKGVLGKANDAARSILARGDGLALTRKGQLAAAHPAANRRLDAALARASGSGGPAVLSVPRAGADMPYTLRISRSGTASSWTGFIVLISDPERPVTDPTAILMAALNLSRPSARLVTALLRGDDLKDHARRTGVSRHTVKYHLNRAFAASGTQRQVDLVRIATGIVRDFGAGG